MKRLNFHDDENAINDDSNNDNYDNDDLDVASAETRKKTWAGAGSASIYSGSNSSYSVLTDTGITSNISIWRRGKRLVVITAKAVIAFAKTVVIALLATR